MKPRILILIKGLGLGGAERLLVSGLPYLSREKYDYRVGYFLPWKDALVPEFNSHGIPVTCFNCKTPYSTAAIRQLHRYFRENEISLLHTHLPSASVAGRIASRSCKTLKTVYTEHGCWDRLHPMTRNVNRWTLRWNDLNIAVSQEVRDSMNPESQSQTVVIPNGIDCKGLAETPRERKSVCRELGIPPNDFLIVKVANLSPVKHHEMLIRAFAEFQSSNSASTLILVGQLRDRDQHLKNLANSLGVGERIRITGPRTDVPRIVRSMDVFAMSSKSEGMPVSLLEAMALHKPVVCTNVGGIPNVIKHGVNGLLVDSGNAGEMAHFLLELSQKESLRERLGVAAADSTWQKFDIKHMVRRVEDQYRNLLKPTDARN
ncbi:glycosyltransferase [Rubripirellula sp.]|nr:glycosyltransferase [Rubripirellula sp.]